MLTQSTILELREEPISELHRYAMIPSAFEAYTVFEVLEGTKGFELQERKIAPPYRKDYDAVENPMEWPARFDVSNWTLIVAFNAGERVGGAIGAFDSPGLDVFEGRDDLAVLWDIRVSPKARRLGVGSALFRSIEAWARTNNCRELRVETQNTNVAACRLYAREGCLLKRANHNAYPSLPDEVQLVWCKAVGA
jgi:GNAT superfamily N-acetyltransferase